MKIDMIVSQSLLKSGRVGHTFRVGAGEGTWAAMSQSLLKSGRVGQKWRRM